MARGKSGRIVLEVDPVLKRDLYLELEKNGLTLKDWFIDYAQKYILYANQLDLFAADLNKQYSKTKK